MTSAGINDSFIGENAPMTPIHFVLMLIDVSLTSSIAFGFFFCALVDIGILKDGVCTLIMYAISIIGLFILWACVLVSPAYNTTNSFMVVYIGTVGFGCGSWLAL